MMAMRWFPADALAFSHCRRVAAMAVLATLVGCDGTPADQGPAPIAATAPVAVDTPPPTYPLQLACAGRGGEVVLMLTVGADGVPTEVRTEVSSRRKALDAAAVTAVRTWRFEPATRGGKPVATQIRVPVKFTAPAMRPDVCFQFDEEQRRAQQPAAVR